MENGDRLDKILSLAREIDEKYQDLDRERLGRIWTNTEFLAACATDWGELVEEIMKYDGVRPGDKNIEAIKHELSDLLWALIVLSDRLGIDLFRAFEETMNEIKSRFKE